MALTILTVYALLMLFIFMHSLSQLAVLLIFWRNKRAVTAKLAAVVVPQQWPSVCIQLPIYNEYYVAERLLDNMVKLDYPLEQLEIQVLDDSTDETRELIVQKVRQLKLAGYQITLIHRENRVGYKAGALAHGLESARGEYIAIFDADFMPAPDFLKQVIPYFNTDKVGMVQTRWGHLNKKLNLLTRLQAFALDAHFTIEQCGRNWGKHFINFNGTGGVWRKSCIADAGGWSADTLTEDLDLSYRAQLKDWEFVYLPHVICSAELPFDIQPLKSQQFRWTKGAAECLVKNMPKVLSAKLPWSTKFHAFFHLANSFVFVALFITSLLSVPLLYIKYTYSQFATYFLVGSYLMIGFAILAFYYFAAYCYTKEKNESTWRFLWYFPSFLAASMGLSLHNAIAVIEGYIGHKTPFIRTPKFNIIGDVSQLKSVKRYFSYRFNVALCLEFMLGMYFFAAIVLAFYYKEFGLISFHALLFLGYSFIVYSTITSQFSNK